MHLIFTYGTLKKGHGNHRLLESATYLGTAQSLPEFTMLHLGGFPGIVRGGETVIKGELYEVDDATLSRLDRLEGHPTFYERQPLTVTLEDGTTAEVEGYVLPASWVEGRNQIPTGVWGKDR